MPLVLILAVDTSSPCGSMAVLRDRKVIGTVSTWTDEIYSSRMFRHVEFLLQELSLRLDEFDLFAVATGPGSFTGVRVGLTAIKGWAEVYQKPIAAISGLEAVAIQSRMKASVLVPVIDARRGQIYFGCYRRAPNVDQDHVDQNRLTIDGDECVMTPGEFYEALSARRLGSDYAILTPMPSVLAAFTCQGNLTEPARVDEVSAILAPHVGHLGYLRAQRGELVDALTLDANYIRRSDAELQLKAPVRS